MKIKLLSNTCKTLKFLLAFQIYRVKQSSNFILIKQLENLNDNILDIFLTFTFFVYCVNKFSKVLTTNKISSELEFFYHKLCYCGLCWNWVKSESYFSKCELNFITFFFKLIKLFVQNHKIINFHIFFYLNHL